MQCTRRTDTVRANKAFNHLQAGVSKFLPCVNRGGIAVILAEQPVGSKRTQGVWETEEKGREMVGSIWEFLLLSWLLLDDPTFVSWELLTGSERFRQDSQEYLVILSNHHLQGLIIFRLLPISPPFWPFSSERIPPVLFAVESVWPLGDCHSPWNKTLLSLICPRSLRGAWPHSLTAGQSPHSIVRHLERELDRCFPWGLRKMSSRWPRKLHYQLSPMRAQRVPGYSYTPVQICTYMVHVLSSLSVSSPLMAN